jgi:hypothetical protein
MDPAMQERDPELFAVLDHPIRLEYKVTSQVG